MLRFNILGIIVLVAAVGLPIQATGKGGCFNFFRKSTPQSPEDKLIRKIDNHLSRLPEESDLTEQLKLISRIAAKEHWNRLADLIKHEMDPAICDEGSLERVEKALGMINASGDHLSIATRTLYKTLDEYKKRGEQVCRDHTKIIAVNQLKEPGLLSKTNLGPDSKEPEALLSLNSPIECNLAYYEPLREANRSIATIAKYDKRRAWNFKSELGLRIFDTVLKCFEEAFQALSADQSSRALSSEKVARPLKFQEPCEALLEFEKGAGVLTPIIKMTSLLSEKMRRFFIEHYEDRYNVSEILDGAARWEACRRFVDSSKDEIYH